MSLKLHAFRIKDGEDLYQAIKQFIKSHNIKASFIIGGAAGLKTLQIRLPATPENRPVLQKTKRYEVVSISGAVSVDHMHIHISVANEAGSVFGGHLMRDGNTVRNTAEIGILETDDVSFSREMNETTGWKELVIKQND